MLVARQSIDQDAPTKPIRVMIVDDAVVVRGLLSRWLQESGGIEIIATYRNGLEAVSSNREPDVIVLDIDMPEMDGMTALPLLVKKWPKASIIMASTLTVRNADYTLRSLSMGAHDYVAKPATNRDVTFSTDFKREIVEKVQGLGRRTKRGTTVESVRNDDIFSSKQNTLQGNGAGQKSASLKGLEETSNSPRVLQVVGSVRQKSESAGGVISFRPMPTTLPRILMIGASTGGPKVVLELLNACRPVVQHMPVVIVQHMPPVFTQSFAENISKQLSMDASEAQHGELLESGRIYIAPGGRHLRIAQHQSGNVIALDDSAPVNFFRPSVDVTFMSAGLVYGDSVLGVMLTGMGVDGLQGSKEIVEKGGSILAQDEATSIVWGMPGAVARRGLCSAVAAVPELASIISRLSTRGAR